MDLTVHTTTDTIYATALSDNEIRLSWPGEFKTATSILIEMSLDGINYSALDTLDFSAMSYEVTGLNNGTKYYFNVTPIADWNPLFPIWFSTSATTLIATAAESGAVDASFFPNPTKDYLQVQGFAHKSGMIQIIDSKGRTVKSFYPGRDNNIIQVNDLPSGIYILKCTSADSTVSVFRFCKVD